MGALPLSFASPLILSALALLPVLYWLLRVTPPRPSRIDFPPLRILLDLVPEKETVARTPPWLLLLRLAIAAAIIVALAGPVWNARRDTAAIAAPLLLLVDNGWASAPDWPQRMAIAEQHIMAQERAGRGVAVVGTAEPPQEISFSEASIALERLRGMKPQPILPDRGAQAPQVAAFLDRAPDASVVWIADGLTDTLPDPLMEALSSRTSRHSITIHRDPASKALALGGVENRAASLVVEVVRAEPNGRDAGLIRALDNKGLALGETHFTFPASGTRTNAELALPLELRNEVARLEIGDERSAGAVALVDASARRRRVGIVTGATADTSQPLLAPSYYLVRALNPFAEVREAKGGQVEAISSLLEENPSVMILADIGAVPPETARKLESFVENGGVLIRFAGSRLAAANDDLVPVRLRRGGRTLGGTLSWETPKTLAPFGRESPFLGLVPPAEVNVTRQILAEPDPSLGPKTWAALSDGTPVVTGEHRGKGVVALFHVTADTSWSNLPLSGLFVDMLRTLTGMSSIAGNTASRTGASAQEATLPPLRTLDGSGTFISPPPTAKPIPANFEGRGTADHPPGFYGAPDSPLAVNALRAGDKLTPLPAAPPAIGNASIDAQKPVDLRPWLFVAALAGFLADTLAVLLLGGFLSQLFRGVRGRSAPAAILAGGLLLAMGYPTDVKAQNAPRPNIAAPAAPTAPAPTQREIEAALQTRLAYIITGDPAIDEVSRSGLAGLSMALAQRTAMDPGEPVGLDPAKDELALYPLIYWPIVANRPAPPAEAVQKLDAFMKNGGTVLFDTRDALTSRPGNPSPETLALRRLLQGLDIPELEPIPREHVVTKAFYLLDRFPGRYDSGQTWIEALPPAADDGRTPARAGDGVSPIILTSNDLAAAWAVGRRGEPLYPVVGGDPKQREIAIRGGINIVLYTLTGNYKADQVHVPALLERLGQ